jgi:hypothetical protein
MKEPMLTVNGQKSEVIDFTNNRKVRKLVVAFILKGCTP